MRSARAATSCSWVMSTIVRPLRCRSLSRASTSAVDAESRLPVGSSARMQRRLGDQRPRDRDALLLAARQLAGPVVGPVGQADLGERGEGPLPALGRVDARVDERQLDVAPRRQVRQQVELLEHEPDAAVAHLGQLVLVEATRRRAPARRYVPGVGTSRQPMMCISVDLPEPDGPTIATNSPASIVSVTSRSASTSSAPVA